MDKKTQEEEDKANEELLEDEQEHDWEEVAHTEIDEEEERDPVADQEGDAKNRGKSKKQVGAVAYPLVRLRTKTSQDSLNSDFVTPERHTQKPTSPALLACMF